MDWEQCYHSGITPWDKGTPAPPLVEWLETRPNSIRGPLLVPGCGLGHDIHPLLSLSEAAPIVGLDIAPEAIRRARRQFSDPRVRFEIDDLFALPERHMDAYDWVWEHTCFCAIDPSRRDDYVSAAHRALRPGGQLLAVFYVDPYDDEHRPGEGPPHGVTIEELEERFVGSGAFRRLESYVPGRSYQGREGLERMMRLEKLGK